MSEDDTRELKAYVKEGWHPRIEAAPRKRDWMDATRDQYAYRCLPLAMANAHGWQFTSPRSFEVVWDGGEDKDSIKVRALDHGINGESHNLPVSIFGYGILTFHVESVMRTPPGWNLWITGSPNFFKDGIVPLSGLVETDWSPMSFTMNWKITRPGVAIKFDRGDPFCFFFPVRRGDVESFQPSLVRYEKNVEEHAKYMHWSANRDKWIQVGPENSDARWQKHYFQGIDTTGSRGALDHQTKLKLREFEDFVDNK